MLKGTQPRAAPTAPLLAAERLVRRYGERAVVDAVSFELRQGEILVIVGPNGAGKSTLFRLLLGLERGDGGIVRLGDRPLEPGRRLPHGAIVGVFQRPILFRGTVAANVAFGLRLSHAARAHAVREALAWFGVSALADADVRTLSGGEAQRVALARALVLEPDVLLLDEPSGSLDAVARGRFLQELVNVCREHARGVILITHEPREAFTLADRIAVMERGRIVQIGVPGDVARAPATPFAAELVAVAGVQPEDGAGARLPRRDVG